MSGWHRKRTDTPAVKARAKRYASREHQQAKETFRRLVAQGLATCWRCGTPIPPGSRCGPDWQTGHDSTGTRIMGPEHTLCNRRDGSLRGNAKRNRTQPPHQPPFTPRNWG